MSTEAVPAGERSALVRLAVPLVAQQLGFQLMGNVDAALLGHYSDTGLAAAGVGNNLLFAIFSLGMGVVLGLDTVVPQALGAGRTDDARRALGAGLRIALLAGLACTLLSIGAPFLLSAIGVPREVADDARAYLDMRAFGIVPAMVSTALRSYLAAHNVTRPLVAAVVIGNLINAALDVVLIFGAGPIPPLGVIGAGLATVMVQVGTLVIYFAGVRAIDAGAARPTSTRADLALVTRYGAPIAGHMFAEIGIFGVATMIAAHLGTIPAAAHSIALSLASFTFSLAVGVGAATSVRVGHAVGAGDLALARRRGAIGLGTGLSAMACFAALFLLVPSVLAGLFTDETAVIVATVPLLRIAALFQLSDGTQAISAGALRGLGDNRATFIGNLIGHYAIGLLITIVLTFVLDMGAPGLWWGLSAGLTATGLYLVWRFHALTRPRA